MGRRWRCGTWRTPPVPRWPPSWQRPARARSIATVNNAGIFKASAFLDITEADWDAVIDVNLKGSFLVGQAVARVMVANDDGRGRGAIVNMSSVNGTLAIPSIASYNASKGAINQLTRVMALSFADRGVRVNAVAPGTIATELALNAVLTSDEARARIMSRTPMKRLGEPGEIAAARMALVGGREMRIAAMIERNRQEQHADLIRVLQDQGGEVIAHRPTGSASVVKILDQHVLRIHGAETGKRGVVVNFPPIIEGDLAPGAESVDRLGHRYRDVFVDPMASGSPAEALRKGQDGSRPEPSKQPPVEVFSPWPHRPRESGQQQSDAVGCHAPRAESIQQHHLHEDHPQGRAGDGPITERGDDVRLPP